MRPPEIGTTFLCQPFALVGPPFGDPRMMSREKNLGYRAPLPKLGLGVLGGLKKTLRKTLLDRAFSVAKDAGYKTDCGVNQRHCSDFAARHHKIAQ